MRKRVQYGRARTGKQDNKDNGCDEQNRARTGKQGEDKPRPYYDDKDVYTTKRKVVWC